MKIKIKYDQMIFLIGTVESGQSIEKNIAAVLHLLKYNLQLVKRMQLKVLIGSEYHKNIQSYYDANILTHPIQNLIMKTCTIKLVHTT